MARKEERQPGTRSIAGWGPKCLVVSVLRNGGPWAQGLRQLSTPEEPGDNDSFGFLFKDCRSPGQGAQDESFHELIAQEIQGRQAVNCVFP